MAFRGVEFPLSFNQRYYLFRQILWNYNVGYLEPQDYKALSRPRKVATFAAFLWIGGFLGLQQLYTRNPENFYKKFLFTPWAPLYLAVIPLGVLCLFWKTDSDVYQRMYDKYVGKMSDEELLMLDCKFNPNRKIIYEYMIQKHKKEKEV